ncbi:MAG: type II toxin-antitoxin system YafQ family toxin [Synergistaceae bacterium]|jgi:mRNA interferase YafQ|nr:type II toxin-antitoxin system YafQ family toxin [Synergistaceae bacterium]
MYEVALTSKFRRDYKRAFKRGYDMHLLEIVVECLAAGLPLPAKYQDHDLTGNWPGYRECHITSDWLMIYKIENDILILTLTRTGTHSDLFKM